MNNQMREALVIARAGLVWYQENYPETFSECDNEALEQIDAALAAVPVELSSNPLQLDTDSAREYLVENLLPKFSDSTFAYYVRNELAGDFAYQVALYLQSQAQQPNKEKILVEAITEVLRVLETDNEAILDTVWTTRGDNETLWEHCAHVLEQVTGIEYKPAEQLVLDLQSQAQQEPADSELEAKRKYSMETGNDFIHLPQAQQTESKLDCVKATTGNHDKFHELLESILNAGERVAMPVSFLSIINDAGMKFIKSLPPAPEGGDK